MLSGGLASSVGSIYPRQWGTESKGLGFLKEKIKVLGKGCSGDVTKTYQDGGNGAGWSGGSQWFLELTPERWFQGTGCPPTPAERK